MALLTNLPVDVLDELMPYLDVRDFLALTASCKYFRENFLNDPVYWSTITVGTFRVRNRPSAERDGLLWRNLYRRMRTQTQIHLWGQASRTGEPEEVELGVNGAIDPGIISDLQCGGWCTVFLNNRGELFLQGKIDGDAFNPRGVNHTFAKLKLPDSATGYQASIRQFSAGRKHILGLADDGTVWLWHAAGLPAKEVTLQGFETPSGSSDTNKSDVALVVAGWSTSAIYTRGRGIEYWPYISPTMPNGQPDPEFDSTTLRFVPLSDSTSPRAAKTKSAYGNKTIDSQSIADDDSANKVGEVVSFILLEHYIVFCTDRGKLLVHKPETRDSFILPSFEQVTDIQGTFRSFAIFRQGGIVTTTYQIYLDQIVHTGHSSQDLLEQVPALQKSGVIQIAFGDYHFHALHSDGHITAHGKDPGMSGALGLGRLTHELQMSVRGIAVQNATRDGIMLPKTRDSKKGRSIWLYAPQRAWVEALTRFCVNTQGDFTLPQELESISDWVEDYGTRWEGDMDQHGLNAYFALSVAAGGWRGGALMLVDKDAIEPRYYNSAELLQNLPNMDEALSSLVEHLRSPRTPDLQAA